MSETPVRRFIVDGVVHGVRAALYYGAEVTWCKFLREGMLSVWSTESVTCLKCLALGDTGPVEGERGESDG